MHLSELISDVGNMYWGTSTSTGWQATSNWGRYETSRRKDDVLLTTSTGKGTSYVAADGGSDNESDVDPPREPRPDGAEVVLFSEPEPVPAEPEGGSDEEEEDPRFRAYSPPTHMHNIDLSEDDALEFPDLPHRRRDRASSLLDSGVSQDHPKMDSSMLASLILPMVKEDPRTSVPVLISYIRSQLRYMPFYHKAWIAKQKALEKMHSGWDASYNEVWQWCQVLERYISGCITDLETDLHTTMTDCSVDAKCSNAFSGPLSNAETHFYTASHWYKLMWTQAYDGGLRYGYMTTNLAEYIISVLKGKRHLPITSIVRETYFPLAVLFPKQAASYKGQIQKGHVWCWKVLQAINKSKVRANTMNTVCHDGDNLWFRVTEFDIPNQGIAGGQYHEPRSYKSIMSQSEWLIVVVKSKN
ncbi:hypothetical protein J1N35_007385 [Gossypium stocksii]|uniref:Uncharacterized protein n=1 Tax=Gossypium stocksii TaxID=47602 RepID=A0A9D3W6Y2_9ROSI|nr:hypothetical protein J1N35_007385 [Gossypium stocksii]